MGKKINRDLNGYREADSRDRTTQAFEVCQAQRAVDPQQANLLNGLIDIDIAAIEAKLLALQTVPAATEKVKVQTHYVASRVSTHIDVSRA